MFLPGSKNVLMEYMMRNRNNPLGVVRGGVDVMQAMASGLRPNAQAAKQTAMPAPAQPEQKKPGFLEGNGVFGIPKEALFMGGAGLLAGNRHNGAQLALQGFAGGMQSARQRQEQAKQQAKMDKFKEGLTPEQAMLFDVAPQAVAQGMAGRMFAEPTGPSYADRLARERFEYEQAQDAKGPEVPWYITEDGVDPRYVEAQKNKKPLVNVTNNPNALPSKDNLTPLQLKMDEAYSDLLVKWNIGGQGDLVKQVDQLDEVLARLESGEDVTGAVWGNMPDWLLAGLNPNALDTRELVQEVVQRSLRETLGAQFTEKEAEMLLARAYNPRLDEKQNALRVRRLVAMIKARGEQLNSLSTYMGDFGTATGWDGSLVSANSMLAELDGLSSGQRQPRKRYNQATGKMEVVE